MLKIAQACTSLGSSNPGSEEAPQAIIQGGLLAGLEHNRIGYQLLDPIAPKVTAGTRVKGLRNYHEVTSLNRRLYEQLTTHVQPTDKMLSLGGDHSIGMGSMSAAKTIWPAARVVYIDAHPDALDDPADSPSGNLHGYPASTVLGDGLAGEFGWPHYDYSEMLMIGLKDIDPAEARYLREHEIRHFSIDFIIEHGLGLAMRQLLDWAGNWPLLVALDIDSIDVSEAPGTGIINRGGLTYREISYICRQLAAKKVVAVDVVEVNPRRDVNNQTVELAGELALSLLGAEWSAYTRYLVSNRNIQTDSQP